MIRLASLLLLLLPASALADGPHPDVPELQVLSNYVGEWKAEVTSDQSPLTSATHSAKWILDGRFLQQDVTLTSADGESIIKSHNLYTYDADLGKYRTWTYVSDGNVYEATGTWDASAKKLTFRNQVNGLQSQTTAHFVKDGVEHWKWHITGPNGETVFEMDGKSTRTGQ